MTDPRAPEPTDEPRGEAPKWAPLAALGGLLLTLLFTTWYMDTEPPHRWKDAAVDLGPADAAVDARSSADAEPNADAAPDGGR